MRAMRTLAATALIAATVVLAGCLDYREALVLKPDGSGTLTLDFVVDMALMAEVSQVLGEEPDPDAMKGPTKAEIMQGLDVEGIGVRELEIKHKGTKSKVHLVIDFATIAALRQIEGFGDDRRIEFFDEGEGMVRVVYSFDTSEIIPIDEFTEDAPPEEVAEDPIEKKILEITARARDGLKFRSKVTLPGEIKKSNGKLDGKSPAKQTRVWRIDKETDPKKHAKLGRGKIRMMMLVERSALPFVKELKPLPKRPDQPSRGADKGPQPPAPGGPPPPGR